MILLALVIVLAVRFVPWALNHGRYGGWHDFGIEDNRRNALFFVLYLTAGALIAGLYFIGILEEPFSFARVGDNTSHYAYIRSFLDSGDFSILSVSKYPELSQDGFYPAVWHVMAALVCSLSNVDVASTGNAVIFTVLAFVYPGAMFGFMSAIFREYPAVILSGFALPLSFVAFPWGFLMMGQLIANLMGYALVPMAMALFVWMFTRGDNGKHVAIGRAATMFAVCLVITAAAQPNAVFVVGMFCIPYGISLIWGAIDASPQFRHKGRAKLGFAALILLVACGVWALFYIAPFMQSVVTFTWGTAFGKLKAIVYGLLLSLTPGQSAQLSLATVVVVGVAWCFVRGRSYLWLVVAWAAAFVVWWVSVSCSGVLHSVLSGFWYTDYHRKAGTVSAVCCA